MEKLFTILALLITLPVTGQDLGKMPYHPFREIDGTYYSLHPLYDWLKADHRERGDRPMRKWIDGSGRVVRIVPAGLVVENYIPGRTIFDANGLGSRSTSGYWGNPFLLRNHPYHKRFSDKAGIQYIAIQSEKNWKDPETGETLKVLDYGKPYDPTKR